MESVDLLGPSSSPLSLSSNCQLKKKINSLPSTQSPEYADSRSARSSRFLHRDKVTAASPGLQRCGGSDAGLLPSPAAPTAERLADGASRQVAVFIEYRSSLKTLWAPGLSSHSFHSQSAGAKHASPVTPSHFFSGAPAGEEGGEQGADGGW